IIGHSTRRGGLIHPFSPKRHIRYLMRYLRKLCLVSVRQNDHCKSLLRISHNSGTEPARGPTVPNFLQPAIFPDIPPETITRARILALWPRLKNLLQG